MKKFIDNIPIDQLHIFIIPFLYCGVIKDCYEYLVSKLTTIPHDVLCELIKQSYNIVRDKAANNYIKLIIQKYYY